MGCSAPTAWPTPNSEGSNPAGSLDRSKGELTPPAGPFAFSRSAVEGGGLSGVAREDAMTVARDCVCGAWGDSSRPGRCLSAFFRSIPTTIRVFDSAGRTSLTVAVGRRCRRSRSSKLEPRTSSPTTGYPWQFARRIEAIVQDRTAGRAQLRTGDSNLFAPARPVFSRGILKEAVLSKLLRGQFCGTWVGQKVQLLGQVPSCNSSPIIWSSSA